MPFPAPNGVASVAAGYVSFSSGCIDYNFTNTSAISLTSGGTGYPNVFGGAYGNASDRAFKQNIQPVVEGLATVLQLKPSTYEMIDSGKADIGFIAQDVQVLLPELVTADNEGRLLLNYSGIIPVLVHAIQQLSATVATLQAQVQAHAAVLPVAAVTAETPTP